MELKKLTENLNGNLQKMFKNTEEFRTEALHFQEFGLYTKEPIGSKSWYNYWKEFRRRCIEGYHIGSDYITGYHWHMLNACPILQTDVIKESEYENGQNQAQRIKGFPSFLDGQYDYFHYLDEAEKSGEHAGMIGKRGAGKSIMCGSMCARNYHHIPDSKSYCVAASEEYLTNDGIITKAWDFVDWTDNNTPFGKRRHEENSMLHRKSSTKILNAAGVATVDPRSFNSEIMGITVGDSIDKLRGKRGKLIILEEWGNFPKLKKGFNILRPSMESGKNTFGLICGVGTGGTEGSNFEGVEELCTNPRAYRIHAITNRWDEGMENTEFAFFYSADMNYEGAMDKDGNSDKEKARRLIELDRKLVASGNDPHALTRRKAEIPLTTREAMMRISGTQFPIDELKQQEAEIVSKPHQYKEADFIGKFELDQETQLYKFKYDASLTPIYNLNLKDNKNLNGAIVLYNHPAKDNHGKVYENRYVAGIDSYDFDESTTTSLGSCFIGDLFTRRIVAEYTGRPKTSEEFYENTRRLLLYYNAKAMIENANKGIFDYFDTKNCGFLIADEPRLARETLEDKTIRTTSGRRRRGFTPSKIMNQTLRGFLAKWCLESTNNPDKKEEIQLHRFRCLPAIKEMVMWTQEGNYDRVSSLGALMLIMYDRERYNVESTQDHNNLAMDDFFTRNYNAKRY